MSITQYANGEPLLNLTDAFVRVFVSPIRTNRERCALNMTILVYSTRKAFLKKAVVELIYESDEKLYCECLKM